MNEPKKDTLAQLFKTTDGKKKLAEAIYRVNDEEQKIDDYIEDVTDLYGYDYDIAEQIVKNAFENAYENIDTLTPDTAIEDWIDTFILDAHENEQTTNTLIDQRLSEFSDEENTTQNNADAIYTLEEIKAIIEIHVETESMTLPEGIAVLNALSPSFTTSAQPERPVLINQGKVIYNKLNISELLGITDEDKVSGFKKLENAEFHHLPPQ